ncbi:MAG: VCBS repeat-containing protein [Minicystis sp.]
MNNNHRRFPRAFALAALVSIPCLAATAHAAPFFQEVVNAYGTQACSGSKTGCWTNYMRMTDIDGDGDLDILFPNADGYFNKGSVEPFVVYLNDGVGNFTNGSQIFNNYSGYVRQIAVGDVDGDGDLDVYVPAAWGDPDALFLNDGGVFVDHASTHLPNLHSHAGAARFVDVDDDGDLDLFVSDGWAQSAPQVAHLYLNDGQGHFTDATAQVPQMTGSQPIDFDVFDADGDFDLDLLIDLHATKSLLWLNDGTGHFTNAGGAIPAQSGLKYGPVACDVDGDGDLDLWFDNSGPNYTEQLLINDGNGTFTDETSQRVTGNPGADDNGVACVDIDGDGDFDAVIASLGNVERVLINDGTGHFTLFQGGFPQISDSTLWFDFGDVNGDGRIDVATAQGESSFPDRLYVGTTTPVDTVAPKLRAVQAVTGSVTTTTTPIVHFAVSDNATTDEGPRLLKAWVRVSTPSGMVDVTATFMGGDMFRAVLPAQSQSGVTVSYEACAKDRQGNQGCSPTQTYVVDPGSSSSSTSSSSTSGTGGSTSTSSSTSGTGGSASTSSSTSGGSTSSTSVTTGTGGAGNGGAPGTGGEGGSGGSGEDGGCGCSVPGDTSGHALGGMLGLGLAMIASRRRRRGQ